MDRSINVLVVDDSAICREILSSILQQEPDISVVGQADSGAQAIEKSRQLRPDIITMDIHMPGMDGFSTIDQIMTQHPVPILVVTSAPVKNGVDQTFRAIKAGALDLVKKPELGGPEAQTLINKVRILAGIRVHRQTRRQAPTPTRQVYQNTKRFEIVGVVASSGGPKVIAELLAGLPQNIPLSFVISQHLPEGFLHGFVHWLAQEIQLDVAIAKAGEKLRMGCVRVVPAGSLLHLDSLGAVELPALKENEASQPGSAMLRNIAKKFTRRSVGIVLSGMGSDGAAGMKEIKRQGGLCIVQDQASSLIFDMPRATIEMGAADHVLNIAQIATLLQTEVAQSATRL